MLHAHVKGVCVAASKLLPMLVGERSANTWADNVNDRLGVTDVKRLSKNRLAGRATVKRGTSGIEPLSRSLEDAAADSAAALELCVRRVDNRIYAQCRDVLLHEHDTARNG